MLSRILLCLVMCPLVMGALTSCGVQRTPKAGMALMEISRKEDGAGRIRNARLVEVNGEKLSRPRQRIDLSPGAQVAVVRFAFPGTEDMDARLKFQARAGRSYTVTFDPFPYSGREGSGGNLSAGGNAMDVLLVPVAAGVIAATGGVGSVLEQGRSVEWTHVDVVSSDLAEGIVERVRVP